MEAEDRPAVGLLHEMLLMMKLALGAGKRLSPQGHQPTEGFDPALRQRGMP